MKSYLQILGILSSCVVPSSKGADYPLTEACLWLACESWTWAGTRAPSHLTRVCVCVCACTQLFLTGRIQQSHYCLVITFLRRGREATKNCQKILTTRWFICLFVHCSFCLSFVIISLKLWVYSLGRENGLAGESANALKNLPFVQWVPFLSSFPLSLPRSLNTLGEERTSFCEDGELDLLLLRKRMSSIFLPICNA